MFSRGSRTEEKFLFAVDKAVQALCAAYMLAGGSNSIGVMLVPAEGGADVIIETDNPDLKEVIAEVQGKVRSSIDDLKQQKKGMM